MLERLLDEIRLGGTLETNVLAARLQASPQLISTMLEHLERLGLIQGYTKCAEGCSGCAVSDACASRTAPRLWQSRSS